MLVLGPDVTPAFGQREKLVDRISTASRRLRRDHRKVAAAPGSGVSVALVAVVGADPAGTFMLDQLTKEGVDVSAVRVRADTPTGMTVVLSRGGDRAILTALGTIAALSAADVPPGLLARARHVHVSSYFLRLADSLEAWSRRPAGGGPELRAPPRSLDTNWDPSGRWGDDQLQAAVLAQADVLLPNEAEALALTGA